MTYDDLLPHEKEMYRDLDLVSKRAPLERDKDGIIRFQSNWAVVWMVRQISLNDLWMASRNGHQDQELRQVYRMMGYSLCGFMDIFCQ